MALDNEAVEAAADPLPLRFFGDQVLRRQCQPVTELTGEVVELAERMLVTMEQAAGVGLAAPQVGRTLRIFTHALADDAPQVLINPEIVESSGEWTYNEGCLSIPGLYFDLVRPKLVGVRAVGIDGRELEIEADELLARVVQHEIDHLDGVLFVDRLTGEARQQASLELAERVAGTLGVTDPLLTGRKVPGLRRRPRSAGASPATARATNPAPGEAPPGDAPPGQGPSGDEPPGDDPPGSPRHRGS